MYRFGLDRSCLVTPYIIPFLSTANVLYKVLPTSTLDLYTCEIQHYTISNNHYYYTLLLLTSKNGA